MFTLVTLGKERLGLGQMAKRFITFFAILNVLETAL